MLQTITDSDLYPKSVLGFLGFSIFKVHISLYYSLGLFIARPVFLMCCAPLCKQQFSRGSGIKCHRDSCSIFQNAERDRLSRRKAHRNSTAPVSGRRPLRAVIRHPSQSPAFATPAYVAVRFTVVLLLGNLV